MDNKETGYLGKLTSEQEKTLTKFKDVLVSTEKNINFQYFDDHYLLRFLRARKFDLEKTTEMFRNYLAWRRDFGVDDIDKYEYYELPIIKGYYPHGYHKTDKLGRPIYIEIIGLINVEQLFKNTSEDRLLKYYVRSYEHLLNNMFPACTKSAGKHIETQLSILDMNDEASKFLFGDTKKFVKITANIAQNYYPEILGQMFIVNAPFTFKAIWAIVKAFIDEKTRNKITIEGSKYQKKLLEIVDADNLPSILGGKCKCEFNRGGCMSSDIGPWNPEGNKE